MYTCMLLISVPYMFLLSLYITKLSPLLLTRDILDFHKNWDVKRESPLVALDLLLATLEIIKHYVYSDMLGLSAYITGSGWTFS